MLTISKELYNQLIDHAINQLPIEACGYLAGKEGVIEKVYNLTNIDQSADHFSFDPAEQFSTVKDARKNGLEILANYHSHPSTPARPSEEDIKLAYDPDISYVIVSLANIEPYAKSFKIRDGKVNLEEITLIE